MDLGEMREGEGQSGNMASTEMEASGSCERGA